MQKVLWKSLHITWNGYIVVLLFWCLKLALRMHRFFLQSKHCTSPAWGTYLLFKMKVKSFITWPYELTSLICYVKIDVVCDACWKSWFTVSHTSVTYQPHVSNFLQGNQNCFIPNLRVVGYSEAQQKCLAKFMDEWEQFLWYLLHFAGHLAPFLLGYWCCFLRCKPFFNFILF